MASKQPHKLSIGWMVRVGFVDFVMDFVLEEMADDFMGSPWSWECRSLQQNHF